MALGILSVTGAGALGGFLAPLEHLNLIKNDFWTELAKIQAESIGWIPIDEAAYLHLGSDTLVIEVVGIVKPEMQGSTILWVF